MDISLKAALSVIGFVVSLASQDLGKKEGGPIAVTLVGADGRRIASASMEGVMPVSVGLDENKAYTAILGQRSTLEWEEKGLDGRNFTDTRFTCFGGGVPIKIKGKIIGAVGVSGRHSSKKDLPADAPLQDHELALQGVKCLRDYPF